MDTWSLGSTSITPVGSAPAVPALMPCARPARVGRVHLTLTRLRCTAFNFSHIISELSFGPFLPSLTNPLDMTINTASAHFHKFQYFMSIVPTVYSIGHPTDVGSVSVFTNQYAVTEQSTETNERSIPGIFFKYDIEPILLNIVESRDGVFVFLIKIINVLSGALVAGHWGFTLSDWVREVMGRRRRSGHSDGMLGAKVASYGA